MSVKNTKMHLCSRRAMFISFAGVPFCLAAAGETYEQSILQYREDAEEHFRSTSGPLTLVARFSPHEGILTLGGDPASSLVVPDKAAPARIGEVTVKGGKATLRF